LSFSVFKVDSKFNRLVRILKKVQGTGIVYCKSRKRTKEISDLLQMHGITALHYHAGLSTEERAERQQAWMDNKIRVMVCTNAFGMGIDKADVRFVVHADMPDCIENYYQEAGRCGRDGRKAYAVLLFDEADLSALSILHEERYPSLEKIKEVYSALVNFLQIPLHSGQDHRYSFELEKMVRHFNLNIQLSLNVLKALEQDGWLEYNEKSFIPSTLVFTTSKESLYEFYRNHPAYEEISTLLLRTYDGIFDFPAFISENTLAGLTNIDIADIKQQLIHLNAFGIVDYTPQNSLPQLTFRKNRVATEDLRINMKPYLERKEMFRQRVGQMIAYTSTDVCRSSYITNYFGEPVNDCGICDNCLKRKAGGLTQDEFNLIRAAIEFQLSQRQLTAEDLLDVLSSFQKAKIWKVVQFLKAENRLALDSKGCLTTVKTV
jgi:ATP-dependent DNA helicase RecQ